MPSNRLGVYTRYPLALRETPSALDYIASDEEVQIFTKFPTKLVRVTNQVGTKSGEM